MSSNKAAVANGEGTEGSTSTSNNDSKAKSSQKPADRQQPSSNEPLFVRYPVQSSWEFQLVSQPEPVSGTVYCTDEVSQTIVLIRSLKHTTLATEVFVVHADRVVSSQSMPAAAALPDVLTQPLPKVQKKALEDRERRAIKLAEESLRHINQKASPEGQAVFDRLVKACGEVVWKGESILVLKQIQVDAPYGPEECRIVQKGAKEGLDKASLERVQKIVAANPNATNGSN